MQVSDSMLEAAARIQSLTAVDTGLSSLCTQKGVLKLLQLTGLQALSAIGRSAQDFGLLQLEDVRRLAALTSLRLLEVCQLSQTMQSFATKSVLLSPTLSQRLMYPTPARICFATAGLDVMPCAPQESSCVIPIQFCRASTHASEHASRAQQRRSPLHGSPA